MIADLDRTLRELLVDEWPKTLPEIEILFEQPKRDWSTRIERPTLNLYLYDVRENAQLRTHQWETIEQDTNGRLRSTATVAQKRTPLRIDCFYMLTAWATGDRDRAMDEHLLMSYAMLILGRYPILPGARLLGQLQNPKFDVRTRMANHDVLTNPAELWSALDNEIRPTISYVVTLTLDPWETVEGPAVQTVTVRSGPSTTLPQRQQFIDGQLPTEVHYIGGMVRRKDADGTPLANINVAIRGTGLMTVTDSCGRYRLANVPAGQQILVAWPEQGTPQQKPIGVPMTKAGTYDIELDW